MKICMLNPLNLTNTIVLINREDANNHLRFKIITFQKHDQSASLFHSEETLNLYDNLITGHASYQAQMSNVT